MVGIRSMSKRERRRLLGDIAFILPQLILYIGLTIVPLIVTLPMLFTDRNEFVDNQVQYIGLDNFTRVYEDEDIRNDFLPALSRTARFVLLNYAAVYVFGMTLALLMYEIGFKGGIFTVIYLPMMVSGLALGFLAIMLFSRSTGTLNLLFLELGWIEKPLDIRLATGTTIILPLLVGWQYAGFNMAIFLAGLLNIPRDVIEAAVVDGASYRQRLVRIYLPLMIPSIIIATLFCLIGSAQIFDHLVALGGMYQNKEAEFISIIFFQYGFGRGRLALGMTLAVITGVPLLIMGVLLQRLQRRLQLQF